MQTEQEGTEVLCFEARRLGRRLSEHPEGKKTKTYALLALLCFHAARLAGRMDDDGGLIQLEVQDRSKWDHDMIGRGFHFLEKASMGNELSENHLEACFGSLLCRAPT